MDLWAWFNQIFEAVVYYGAVITLARFLHTRWGESPAPLAGLYVASYTIAQYLTSKFTTFIIWTVPCGNIPFVATLALMDLIVVKWGLHVARGVIFTGFVVQILVLVANQLAIVAPPAPSWNLQEYFASLMGSTARVAVVSPAAYLACELVNAHLTWMYKRRIWQRTLYSDPVGLVVDTMIFVPLAFYGEVPDEVLLEMVVGLSAIKMAMIPFNLMALYLTRRILE